jgi:hypothetical protein
VKKWACPEERRTPTVKKWVCLEERRTYCDEVGVSKQDLPFRSKGVKRWSTKVFCRKISRNFTKYLFRILRNNFFYFPKIRIAIYYGILRNIAQFLWRN